ncbi:eukaryotic translation initiation factor 4 gamma 1-like [Amphiura filiformis]|uniref:eukaryotic translation initiation factor 4 gamma 1-like n=1 Tax=Amphiura filiformis TaxID=82378 RepID=UPI003B212EE6
MASSHINKLEETMACPVCEAAYPDDPICLPCLHNVCFECLEEWFKISPGKSQVICPCCKQPASLPKGGIRGFNTLSSVKMAGVKQTPPQLSQMGDRKSLREPKKVITTEFKCLEVSLKKAENPWKPSMNGMEKHSSEEEAETEDLIKTFRAILNKLTPTNFQTLMSRTLQLPIDNEERLIAIIDLVFEKAITELAHSKTYANMSRVLSQIKVPASNESGLLQFRTVLINRCQRAFEAEKTEKAHLTQMRKEIDTLQVGSTTRLKREEELCILLEKSKQKALGNIYTF